MSKEEYFQKFHNMKTFINALNQAILKADDYQYVLGNTKERIIREFDEILNEGLIDEFAEAINNGQKIKNTCQSIILYLIGLTDEEPLCEFVGYSSISTNRISPIDIDIDVSAERRQEVVDFIRSRITAYPIMAFSTINFKSGIKDLGKVVGLPYSVTDAITKSIPDDTTQCTDELAYNILKQVLAIYPTFFEEADKLNGAIRHCTVHASGIAVFNSDPWENYISLRKAPRKSELVVDADGSAIEKLGLMKIDILGSTATDIIQKTTEMWGEDLPPVDVLINDIDLISGFATEDVIGIFQADGEANKRVFRQVGPRTFNEVMDCISLSRPGAIDQLEAYCSYTPLIKNEEVLKYLSDTRGILLYQEQVIEIAMGIGGLTGEEADILRRCIGKKEDNLNEIKQKFIDNAREKIGEDADALWELMQKHVGYSFNKSHAMAYALQAVREKYLQISCPLYFWCNVFALCKEEEKYKYRQPIAAIGAKLFLPSFHEDCNDYRVVNDERGFGIQLPISAVKGLSKSNIDFNKCRQINDAVAAIQYMQQFYNKKQIELLIKIGFFDCLDEDRNHLLDIINNNWQTSLEFGDTPSKKEKINQYEIEKELFGYWVTEHPMQIFQDDMDKLVDINRAGEGSAFGIVDKVYVTSTNHLIITISDDTYAIEVFVHKRDKKVIPNIGSMVSVNVKSRNGMFYANGPLAIINN